jgi:hypothetical protein
MKLLRIIIGAALGAIGATVAAWCGLYLVGIVRGSGSLFDTNPEAANCFFAAWFALVLVASIVGGVKASRP